MGLDVSVNAEQRDAPVALLERAVAHVVRQADLTDGEISLTLLGDREITELNRQYLGRDRPTDVIAFSLGGPGQLLGDVYVGYDQAVRQADEAGVTRDEELVRLAVHGTLHVLGHDHPDGPDRVTSPMFTLQESLVGEILGRS
jgi:probable rRNA maturation factor